ncbi:hypothetical protein [Clostridium ihumii]|uniref:hypothetical protein n=1 Tax=Clostridium ihumii TaxID=1470356 RepID=UPI003D34A9FB
MKKKLKVILIIMAAIMTIAFYGCENKKGKEKNNKKDIVILEENIREKDEKEDDLQFIIQKSVKGSKDIPAFKSKYEIGMIIEDDTKIIKIKDTEKDTTEEIKFMKGDSSEEEKLKTNDGKNIFFLGYNKLRNRAIMRVNLSGKAEMILEIDGKKDRISDFNILKSEKIIFSGTFNNEKGLFYFNRTKNEIKTILKGRDVAYTISPDERKIIYIALSSENKFNLYAGKLEEDKITSNELLYENVPQNILNWNNVLWEENSKAALVVKLKEDKEVKEYYEIKFDEGIDEIENVVTKFVTGFYTVNKEVYEKDNKIINKVFEDTYTENDFYENCAPIVPYVSDKLKSIIINDRLYPYKESLEEYKRKNVYYEVKDIGISDITTKDGYITCECKFKLIKIVDESKKVEEKEKTICLEWDIDRWVVNELTGVYD